ALIRPKPDAPAAADRTAYAQTDYPRQAFGWSPVAAWRADRFLYVRAPKRELYDDVADPGASHSLVDSRSRVADGMDQELRRFIERGGRVDPARGQTRIDPAVAERLAALGYIAGSGSTPASVGVDPKDRVQIANALHAAIVAVEDGAFQRAVPLLERVTASEPTIAIAQLNLGVARARQRRYAEAIGPLREAVRLQPNATNGHYELGLALYETGDVKGSAAELAVVA